MKKINKILYCKAVSLVVCYALLSSTLHKFGGEDRNLKASVGTGDEKIDDLFAFYGQKYGKVFKYLKEIYVWLCCLSVLAYIFPSC